ALLPRLLADGRPLLADGPAGDAPLAEQGGICAVAAEAGAGAAAGGRASGRGRRAGAGGRSRREAGGWFPRPRSGGGGPRARRPIAGGHGVAEHRPGHRREGGEPLRSGPPRPGERSRLRLVQDNRRATRELPSATSRTDRSPLPSFGGLSTMNSGDSSSRRL